MNALQHGWKHLNNAEQRKFAKNCVERRSAYEAWTHQRVIKQSKDILIVADRPGPKAPQTDAYHHTPFYSKLHSGGWLNSLLVEAKIPETRLFWSNMATWDNKPGDIEILTARPWKHVAALGNNAAKFLKKNNVAFTKFDHPQYHKRWKSDEAYQFIQWLGRMNFTIEIFNESK